MNIDEVLLTPKETEKLANEHLEKHGCLDTFRRERDKAQCLKLLEWLNGKCMRHITFGQADGFYPLRKDCRYCMSELESKLKEGR